MSNIVENPTAKSAVYSKLEFATITGKAPHKPVKTKRVGILGFGFMGNMHFNKYKELDGAKVVALCDIVEQKLTGKGVSGNIGGTGQALDLSGIEVFTDAEKMFASAELDAVSIALPTYLHREYTIKALNHGLHVFCEKPMALTSADCQDMVDTARKCGKYLQVGHCIRFWPEYAKAKELINSGKYGKVRAAVFRRLSLSPTWVWENWLLNPERSGGALLDLHIHDADFIQYVFGMPHQVWTRAVKGNNGGYDHAVTQYIYDGDEKVITAEGGWIMTKSYGFQMSFEIILEKAVLCYNNKSTPTLMAYPESVEAFAPDVEPGNAYSLELKHFIRAISGQSVPDVLTPAQSLQSLKLIEAEQRSISLADKVRVK